MKWLPYAAGLVLALLVGRNVFPRTETITEYVQGPTVTDTVHVPRLEIEQYVVTRERVLSDTVRVPYEVIISDPVTIPCPDLPPQRGITRLEAGHSLDTASVALFDLRGNGVDLTRTQEVQRLWIPPGQYLTYIEATDPLRVDFQPFPKQPESCGFWCRAQWALGGVAVGVIGWELAR